MIEWKEEDFRVLWNVEIIDLSEKREGEWSRFRRWMRESMCVECGLLEDSKSNDDHSFIKESRLKFLEMRWNENGNRIWEIDGNMSMLIFDEELFRIGRIKFDSNETFNRNERCMVDSWNTRFDDSKSIWNKMNRSNTIQQCCVVELMVHRDRVEKGLIYVWEWMGWEYNEKWRVTES